MPPASVQIAVPGVCPLPQVAGGPSTPPPTRLHREPATRRMPKLALHLLTRRHQAASELYTVIYTTRPIAAQRHVRAHVACGLLEVSFPDACAAADDALNALILCRLAGSQPGVCFRDEITTILSELPSQQYQRLRIQNAMPAPR